MPFEMKSFMRRLFQSFNVRYTIVLLSDWWGFRPTLKLLRYDTEEIRKNFRGEVLHTITMTEIVLGKFLGVMGYFAVVVLAITLTPLSLLAGGSLDVGLLGSSFIGLLLLIASFAAAGLFMSTLTAHPPVAAISTFGLLLLLWNMDWAGTGASEGVRPLFSYIGVTSHFNALLQGVVDSADLIYSLIVIATFLVLAIRRLDSMRLGH